MSASKRSVVLHIKTNLYRSSCISGCAEKQWVVDINAWIDNKDGTIRWKPNTSFVFTKTTRKPNLKSNLFSILCAAGLIEWKEGE